jgi:multiple sugar transport system permease protein
MSATVETRRRYLLDNERFLGSVMLLPSVVYIIGLVGVPLVLAILYSFSDATTGNPGINLVGLDTFKAAVRDPTFLRALRNTFVITAISQLLVVVMANILAIALSAEFKGKWIARFLILLPWTTPVALGTIAWLWLLDSVFSPIDWILGRVGLISEGTNLHWLGEPGLALGSVIAVQVWRLLPLATVILLAGLSSIPKDITEAAEVDGAGFWRRLFEIRIPLLLPIIAVAILFGVVFTIVDMTVVFVLTRGGPVDATQVLPSWAFFKGIEGGSLSEGAAVAVFLFPVLVGVAALILRFARRAEVG